MTGTKALSPPPPSLLFYSSSRKPVSTPSLPPDRDHVYCFIYGLFSFFVFRSYLLLGCLIVGWLTIILSAAVIFRNRLMVNSFIRVPITSGHLLTTTTSSQQFSNDSVKTKCFSFFVLSGYHGTPEKSVANNQSKSFHSSIVGPDYNRLLLSDFHDAIGMQEKNLSRHSRVRSSLTNDRLGFLFSDQTQAGGVLQ